MRRRSRITWLTTLSLDAPIVAIVWQHAVALEYGILLEWHHRLLVFSSVWLGYTADRWLDAWKHACNLSQRHAFHADQRWRLLAVWSVVLVGSIAYALNTLENLEIQRGFALAGLSLLATLAIQKNPIRRHRSALKSSLTASLVAAAVLLFALPSRTLDTLAVFILLAALFSLNCSLIHHWDRSIDAAQERDDATPLRPYALAIGGVLALSIGRAFFTGSQLGPLALVSAFGLASLHLARNHIHIETRRTLADIALLTPIAVWL